MSTYKGLSKKEFEALPREQQLARMALVRPGFDSDGNALPEAEQDAELLAYVEFFFNVRFPTTCHPDCVGKCTPPARVLCDAYYSRYPLIVLKASRSAGKTSLLTTLAMAEVISLATSVDVLGASERQSNYVMEYINSENPMTVGSWWTAPNAPTALLDPAQSLRSKQVLTNGGRLECLTASPKTVRGRRPVKSRCDEVDEAELSLIKSAQGCPKTDHVNKIKKQMLLASTHQHTDGTFSYYWNLAAERNKEASIKAGKPTVVIPAYQYCYKDVLVSNGGFLSDEEMEETRLVTPEDMWEAEYENGEPNFTGRLFKQWQLDFLFDKHMLGQEAEETKFSGAEDELIEIPLDKLFQNKTVEVHGHIKRFRTAHRTQDHLEFNYGADFANDVDWSVYNRLVTNVLKPQDPTYVQGWYRTGRKDTWKEVVESYNDFCNEHPGMGQHDETGNKAVNDYIDCDSEGFTFSKKTKKPLLDALVVAIQNRRIKGPFIDWAYKEFKFLTREHLTGKKHLPDSVASLALAWHSVQESLGEETDGKIPVGFVGA